MASEAILYIFCLCPQFLQAYNIKESNKPLNNAMAHIVMLKIILEASPILAVELKSSSDAKKPPYTVFPCSGTVSCSCCPNTTDHGNMTFIT